MSGSPIRALRRNVIAGLVVIAPVTITALVLWWIFQRLDGLLGRFLYPAIGVDVPGLGLLLLVVILVVAGWSAQRALGARAIAWWNLLLERFPLTRRVYGASNRIVRTVLGEDRRFLKDVVLFEYPSDGRWSIGFLTAESEQMGWVGLDGDPVTVFVPTSPNPTTGWLVIVPRERITRVDMTLEQAFTFILSAGTVAPVGGASAAGPARRARIDRTDA